MSHRPPAHRPAEGGGRRWRALLRSAHRLCGIVAGAGLLWLSLTAIPLIARPDLARHPAPAWLLSLLYGPAQLPPLASFSEGRHRLDGSAAEWTFDATTLDAPPGRPVALLGHDGLWFAVGSTGLVLLSERGEVVERIPAVMVGLERIASAASIEGQVCLADLSGSTRCSPDGIAWATRSAHEPGPQAPTSPTSIESGPITLERALLDLHALRFAGPAAPWIGTLFAVSLAFLAASGLMLALRQRARRR